MYLTHAEHECNDHGPTQGSEKAVESASNDPVETGLRDAARRVDIGGIHTTSAVGSASVNTGLRDADIGGVRTTFAVESASINTGLRDAARRGDAHAADIGN